MEVHQSYEWKKNREKINKTQEKIKTPYTEEKFTLTFEVRPFCYLVVPGLTKRAVLDNQTDRALPSVFWYSLTPAMQPAGH